MIMYLYSNVPKLISHKHSVWIITNKCRALYVLSFLQDEAQYGPKQKYRILTTPILQDSAKLGMSKGVPSQGSGKKSEIHSLRRQLFLILSHVYFWTYGIILIFNSTKLNHVCWKHTVLLVYILLLCFMFTGSGSLLLFPTQGQCRVRK